jgi:hypothetical protein
LGAVTKLLVFVEENHSLRQMRSQMPYAFGLAQRFGYAVKHNPWAYFINERGTCQKSGAATAPSMTTAFGLPLRQSPEAKNRTYSVAELWTPAGRTTKV